MSPMEPWLESLRDPPPPAFPARPHISPATTSSSAPSAVIRRKISLSRKRLSSAPIECVIEAAWALLNVHYSNSDDVLYGFAFVEAGDEEELHGSSSADETIRPLPNRFTYQPDQSVQDCLNDVSKRSAGLISAMTSSPGALRSSRLEEVAATTPFDNQLIIFADIMGLQNVAQDKPLSLECTLGRNGIVIRAFYDPAIVDTTFAQRILGTFEAIIHQIEDVANASRPLGDLNLISPEDMAQLSEWNRTVPAAAKSCMHHLIAERVKDNRSAEAVCDSHSSFTYDELEKITDSLAHVLIERGAGPGKVVPFMFDKSIWAVVAMLATLKSGAAFVPLDTAHKWEDTYGIIKACKAQFVLCSEAHVDRFSFRAIEAIIINQGFVSSLAQAAPVSSAVVPSDPGYIIFTSGSTGKPKGIVCSHQAWCTNALAHGVAERNGPSTRTLQFSAYPFDISISDIFTTLAFGGCVCVPTEAERLNDLAGAIQRMRVTQLAATPTVVQFLKPENVPTLEVLICGGEAMSPDLLAIWAPRVDLMNSYGPAECTSRVACAWRKVGDEGTIIGNALGCAIWVTQSDRPTALAPIGAVGELLVEGHIIADGYLDDSSRTQQAFIEKPRWLCDAFPSRAGGRLYRTGDLVQYTSSGELRFLGRRDTQIKIHGVRLEPGHIEAKIAAELEEGASVVVEKVATLERTILAAFLAIPRFTDAMPQEQKLTMVPKSEEIQTYLCGLQQKLVEDLPSYMVPKVLLPIPAVPLGATGKINRRALQELVKGLPEEELTQYTAARDGHIDDTDQPYTQTEILLSTLWASVCKVSKTSISRQNTFFSLGGDSVSAMKLVALAASEAGVRVSVADVFQHPSLAQLAAYLDSKGAAQPAVEVLASVEPFGLIGGAGTFVSLGRHLSSTYRIATRRIEDIMPCTPMQSGMMAETIASPEAYILQEVLELRPDIDIEKLQDAWETVVMETPIIRTRIMVLPQLGSCQVVMSSDEDIAWSEASDLTTFLSEDKSRHMGYGDPLSRLAIVQGKRGGAQYLVWTCHHAITDARSHQNILSLVESVYNGTQTAPGLDFSQFVQHHETKDAEESKRYWRDQFAGVAVVKFPAFDEDYAPTITDHVDHHMTLLSTTALGVTASILLRASWAIVLAQVTGSPDFVLGVTQHGRDIPLPGIEGCLGPVLATVPVAVKIEDAISCGQLLKNVQQQYIDMIPHQHDGLQNIRKASHEAASACGFHSLLVVQAATSSNEPDALFVPTADRNPGDQLGFGMLLECNLNGDSTVSIRAGFDQSVINAQQVELLVYRLEHVVAQLGKLEHREVPVSKLNMTSSWDLAVLESFNPEVPAVEQCMHWLVEEQARQQPDAIAVDAWNGQLTYSQLLDYSDRLAGHLVELGIGPEVIVPFAFEKSTWSVVAIHAILRAGGACVALDMAHPRTRHQKIVADAEATVIVSSLKSASAISGLAPDIVTVSQETIEALPPRKAQENGSKVAPHNAAFVVYSSGSTGTPKGSILEHGSLCSTSRTNSEVLGVGRDTRAIAFASHSFDVAMEENVIITMYGGTICIPGDDERLDDLPGAMRRMGVNWADLTPTVGRLLTPEKVPSLRTLVLGGEALTQDIINTWAAKVGLFNTYGPSECSIQCTSSRSLERAATGANIGRAVNCQLWVVDAEDPTRLLPPGCVGELLIEGPIVGRGYLKEPTKTKSAFITNLPWAAAMSSTQTNRRFYRTGDLARFNFDGTLDCLGRNDTQIKLHGQRIELGEIEYNIKMASRDSEHTAVAVEAFSPKSSDRKLLAAFIRAGHVQTPGSDLELCPLTHETQARLESIKSKVAQSLPEYMVPSLFIPVTSLPMNTSGKIDRKSLREAAGAFDQSQLTLYSLTRGEPSRRGLDTAMEQKLASLWADVLHIDVAKDPIGADDGFLELGGDSITAMQLVGKAKAKGLILSVSSVMKSSNLADMASTAKSTDKIEVETPQHAEDDDADAASWDVVSRSSGATHPQPYAPFALMPTLALSGALADLQVKHGISGELIEDMYPCTPLQAGLMAITASDPTTAANAYVLRDVYTLPPNTDISLFKAAWAAVVRRTPILRTRIVFVDGIGSCQIVLDERLSWTTANSIDECLEADRTMPMGYGKALSRWTLVNENSSSREAKLVWSIHHSLYDGFSLGLFTSAVDHAYRNALAVPLTSPYVDFIRFVSGTDKKAETSYWTKLLSGIEAVSFPAVPIGKACIADNTVEYKCRLAAKKTGVTSATLLKAAWAFVVSRLSDSDDVVFGVTQFGRDVDVPGVESMAGPTITTVPVRVSVNPQGTVGAYLADIHQQSIEMAPFSHAGLQNIKRMSDTARDACNFQNLLVIQPEVDNEASDSLFRLHESATNVDHLKGFGLVVECAMGDGSITFSAHHDSSVIMPEQVQRLLRQFEAVIADLCGHTLLVRDINMVSVADRADILAWNHAQRTTDINRCIHRIFADEVRRHPTALAIETRDASISYEQLEDLTTDLAHRLQSHGIGPESIVPICVEKSHNGIIAMLGIQKAGGAFVPLNPNDPTERLRGLVEQVNASVVIFSENTAHLNPTVAVGRSTITMPVALSAWRTPLNTSPVTSLVKPHNLAYALFTSGSTGKPKAVELSHRAISSSVMGHATAMGYLPGRGKRVLQFISYTFDPCVIEIFTTLTHGGCVCVPGEAERMNNLSQFVRDFRCDYAIFTPSFARALKPEEFPTLKTLVLGGEPMTKEIADIWGDRLQLINAYGPTETAIVCTSRTIRGPQTGLEEDKRHRPENIGRPVNSLNWVIDPLNHDQLVPVGCIGELAVTGPILARGYLNDISKTTEAFIPSAAWMGRLEVEPQMMYKTGDLVRQDPADGSIIYIGRKDNQTKVNGQRLELGEIETQLKAKSSNVKVAVVIAGKTKLDSKKQTLAAFIEFKDSRQGLPAILHMNDDLQTRLQSLEDTIRRTLPRYMVPTIWIPMSQMPVLAASGKTNRKLLNSLFVELDADQLAIYGLSRPHEDPGTKVHTTDMETTIINLVAKHLGRESKTISPQDSFVRLGGDSIVAIQLIAAARSVGIILSTEDILRQPLISDMARNAKPTDTQIASRRMTVDPFSLLEGDKSEVLQSVKEEYSIPPAAISDILPCTPLQEGLLTLTVKDPDAYVLREIYRLSSKLEVDRFKAAWAAVAQDASVLRSRIVNLESHGCFQIVMAGSLEWHTSNSVKEYIEDDKKRAFRYGVPLCKLGLVETPYNGTFFVLTMHHSIYDGWSKGMLKQKVEEAYESTTAQPTVNPTPAFSLFVKHLQSVNYDDARAFWRGQFAGLEAQSFPRAPASGFDVVLDRDLQMDIHLDRKMGSAFTTSTILKAAWAIVLGRYTGSSEALFGVIQTGRHVPVDGISEMIGPTLTTVPLRVKLDTQSTMVDFLHAIQDQTTQMIKYEHTGLQNIARMGQECREACGFANIMVIQPGNQPDADFFAGHQVQGNDKGALAFGLGLECTLQKDCVQVNGAYDQRLIADSQMQRILNQFSATVQQINLETQASILDIDLFSPEDWEEMTEMNAAVPSDVLDVTHEVIHRMALDASNNVAVNAWDIDLAYWELDYLSSVLAHHLQSLGVGPETIVPLCFEKSGWAVVALLGVIKAGGAFVFCDPSYPIARLTEIVTQVGAKVLLSSLSTASLWESSGLHVQIVDNVAIESLPSTTGMPVTDVTPSNALYVIFTSGSTGKPKGCVIEHHSFLTCAAAQAARASITAGTRILQGASYSFDVSVMEMLTALTVGACICIPSEGAKNRSVTRVINDLKITWAFLTPSVAKFIKPAEVPCLKTLVLGGEALTTQNIQTWADGVQLINGYGPSECTIAASANSHLSTDTDPANIGKALGGTCWIVDADDHNKLAPLGTIGELLIEGPIVARGYLNNPEKTAEVFVQNPDWGEQQAGKVRRLYKTGDLAYFSAEGDIMFVGRKDTQVKVRGQRVELGEIETHLSLSKEIQHAMVMYPKVGLCKGKLVGIISLKEYGATTNVHASVELLESDQLAEASTDMAEITARLSAIVPGYMVPNIWVVLRSFPLLVSGKLNRKRVEQWLNHVDEPTHHRICGLGEANTAQAPQGALETELRNIWAEVLKLPAAEIGTTQDFTALGGDSILAMVVISKLRKKGSHISMGDMIKARTIMKLALLIQQGATTTPFWKEEEVEEVTDEIFDLSPIQQYYANFTLKQSNYLSKQTNKRFNHTFCLRVKNRISEQALSQAMEALVERHSMLRARFVRDENAPCGWRQYIPAMSSESFHFRSWDNYTLEEIKSTLENTRTGLDIENGPILAADLVSVDANEQYFYIVAHHLVVDLVSWNAILRDLEDMVLHGEFLADKPYPFSAWAKLQRDYAQQKLTPELAYPLRVPPADFAYWGMKDRLNIVRDAAFHQIVLSAEDTAALTQACPKHYSAEPMDILCSALWHSFHFIFRDRNTPTIFRYSNGRESEAIPDAGPIDISSTVGWFTTLSPLHVRVSDKDDSLTLLHRTIETRKRIPANGFHYFASRYHNEAGLDPAGRFEGHDNMEITINYLGSSGGQQRNGMRLFEMPKDMEGSLGGQDKEVKVFSLFYVSAEVQDGQMRLNCMWNTRAEGQEKIKSWFEGYEKCLVDVARRAAAGQIPRRRVVPASVARKKYRMG